MDPVWDDAIWDLLFPTTFADYDDCSSEDGEDLLNSLDQEVSTVLKQTDDEDSSSQVSPLMQHGPDQRSVSGKDVDGDTLDPSATFPCVIQPNMSSAFMGPNGSSSAFHWQGFGVPTDCYAHWSASHYAHRMLDGTDTFAPSVQPGQLHLPSMGFSLHSGRTKRLGNKYMRKWRGHSPG